MQEGCLCLASLISYTLPFVVIVTDETEAIRVGVFREHDGATRIMGVIYKWTQETQLILERQ